MVGVTCLARGAAQALARVVLELDGKIAVVLAANDYRAQKVKPENAAEFGDLIGKAATVTPRWRGSWDNRDGAVPALSGQKISDHQEDLVGETFRRGRTCGVVPAVERGEHGEH